jgi:hypothetical protein
VDTITTHGHDTWNDWINDPHNATADDLVKLGALRKFIFAAAEDGHNSEPMKLTTEWVNKKLAPLGVADRLDGDNMYTMEAPATGTYRRQVVASNRDAAARAFANPSGELIAITGYTLLAVPTFVSGPEDPDPAAVHPDAPTTVTGTLEKFREGLMLAVIAGPRLCDHGVNEVLADFGLDPIPARKEFTVTRPATATATTTVTAYDAASAERVAEWRWENGHTAYTAELADGSGGFVVAER